MDAIDSDTIKAAAACLAVWGFVAACSCLTAVAFLGGGKTTDAKEGKDHVERP